MNNYQYGAPIWAATPDDIGKLEFGLKQILDIMAPLKDQDYLRHTVWQSINKFTQLLETNDIENAHIYFMDILISLGVNEGKIQQASHYIHSSSKEDAKPNFVKYFIDLFYILFNAHNGTVRKVPFIVNTYNPYKAAPAPMPPPPPPPNNYPPYNPPNNYPPYNPPNNYPPSTYPLSKKSKTMIGKTFKPDITKVPLEFKGMKYVMVITTYRKELKSIELISGKDDIILVDFIPLNKEYYPQIRIFVDSYNPTVKLVFMNTIIKYIQQHFRHLPVKEIIVSVYQGRKEIATNIPINDYIEQLNACHFARGTPSPNQIYKSKSEA
jgi:hypothetical protein